MSAKSATYEENRSKDRSLRHRADNVRDFNQRLYGWLCIERSSLFWKLFTEGLFDYRIRIRIHSESRFRFTWQIEWLWACLMWVRFTLGSNSLWILIRIR